MRDTEGPTTYCIWRWLQSRLHDHPTAPFLQSFFPLLLQHNGENFTHWRTIESILKHPMRSKCKSEHNAIPVRQCERTLGLSLGSQTPLSSHLGMKMSSKAFYDSNNSRVCFKCLTKACDIFWLTGLGLEWSVSWIEQARGLGCLAPVPGQLEKFSRIVVLCNMTWVYVKRRIATNTRCKCANV